MSSTKPLRPRSPRKVLGGVLLAACLLAALSAASSALLMLRGQTVPGTVSAVTCVPWESYKTCRATVTYATPVGDQQMEMYYGHEVTLGDRQAVRYDPLQPERVRRGGLGWNAALAAIYGAAALILARGASRHLDLHGRWWRQRRG